MSSQTEADKKNGQNFPIVVACPNFRADSGGVVVLHMLVDQLRANGFEAYAASVNRNYSEVKSPILRILKRLNYYRRRGRGFRTHPSLDVPIAPDELIKNAIVVYSETHSGNPLQSSRVVRWLLHKPGFFGIDMKMDPTDEVFYFHPAYADGLEGLSQDRILTMSYFNERFYTNLRLRRSGTCRMIRKGQNYENYTNYKPDDSILLDGKSHEEIAHIFNTTEIFYCHDPYTAYLYFAVRCGCVPVVIPQPDLNSTDWRAGIDLKYGVAYGIEEFDWARETSNQLLEDMKKMRSMHQASLLRFVEIVMERFK
jgi:hypothetical protein